MGLMSEERPRENVVGDAAAPAAVLGTGPVRFDNGSTP